MAQPWELRRRAEDRIWRAWYAALISGVATLLLTFWASRGPADDPNRVVISVDALLTLLLGWLVSRYHSRIAGLLRSALGLTLLALASQNGLAQARVLSAPPEPSLLNITRQWSRASSLGDLRELRTEPDHRELRVWLGFGLTTETQGVILRRANGRWSGFFARVMRCEIQIPRAVGDTASRATMERYNAEARKRCGTTVADVSPGSQVVTTDTLLVAPLNLPDSTIQAAWTDAERAGVSRLPPRVAHSANVDDAAVFVVELRNGNDYRASTIEQLEHPETEADQQVKDIYAALVTRLRNP